MSAAFFFNLFVIGNPFQEDKRAGKADGGCVASGLPRSSYTEVYFSRMCAYGLMNRAKIDRPYKEDRLVIYVFLLLKSCRYYTLAVHYACVNQS